MFSKYDVYTTVQSMYCYPDTDVLINKLDIRDKAELKQAEEEFTAVKQMALLQEPIKGRFTKTHLFRIHRFLFEDVYPFAGHIRKEQISKGDTMFYPPDLIDRELERVFKNIHAKKLLSEQDEEKQIQNLSQTMAELNIIHPFREGNGRSTRIWLDLMLKKEIQQVVDWSKVDKEDYLLAMERSPVKDIEIKFLLQNALTNQITDREVYMKGIDHSYYYEGYTLYKTSQLENN